jgi:hypothetical protein
VLKKRILSNFTKNKARIAKIVAPSLTPSGLANTLLN